MPQNSMVGQIVASNGHLMSWSTERAKDIKGDMFFKCCWQNPHQHTVTADGSDGTFAVEVSAKQMRTGIERECGKGKTLEQMFDTKYVQPTSAVAQAALGMTSTVG